MVFKIMGEFVDGFETMKDIGPAVSVFGGARFPEGHPTYEVGRDLGARLARSGYAVITGGGPGVMEAVCRGAKDVGGTAVGLNIQLPSEKQSNNCATVKLDFDYFFARKVMFMRYAQGFVVLPGGFGTLDELFEALTLIQTRKSTDCPVVLVGRAFWEPLRAWIEATLVREKTIKPSDMKLFTVVETAEEAVAYVRATHQAAHQETLVQRGSRQRPPTLRRAPMRSVLRLRRSS